MTSRDFAFWLQGYLEVASAGGAEPVLSGEQIVCIAKHLALVFKHEIDPSMPGKELDDLHASIPQHPGHGGPLFRC